jgi:hypothetical protein
MSERDTAEQNVEQHFNELEAYREGKLIFDNDFKHYALDIVKAGIEYYIEQMAGSLADIRRGIRAVRCFDPIFIKENDMLTITEHVRDLKSLGLPSLNEACITGIIDNELQTMKQQTENCELELEMVEGAEEYNNKMEMLNDQNGTNKTWKEDYSEYGRRVWKWWGSRKYRFIHATKAVKLVALIQTSSAFVERVFSQVQLITREIGEERLRDNIETRVMRRVNKNIVF